VVPLAFAYGQGLGEILDLPAFYPINTFGQGVVRAILGESFLVTAVRSGFRSAGGWCS
jgi:hypothetical protein